MTVRTSREPRRSIWLPTPKANERAGQRRDEVDLRVGDAADAEIDEQRLGDQSESLRAAGQRADHAECRDAQHDPAVVEPSGRGVQLTG